MTRIADSPSETKPAELGLAGILELASGYQRAQVLFAASGLGIFGLLASGPKTAEEVGRALGTQTRAVAPLLDACTHLGLLSRDAQAYRNSRTAQLFLVPGRETSYNPVLKFWQNFSYGIWSRLEEAVRSGVPQSANGPRSDDLFEHLVRDPERLRIFFDGLAGLAFWPAKRIAEMVDFKQRTHLLDLGGGAGAMSEIMAREHPHLRVTLFDLEPVCKLARERFARADLGNRATALPGDFHRGPLPDGCDVVLLANVLHDWSPEECRALLNKIHASLPSGGQLLIHEVMPDEDGGDLAALFGLALLLDTKRGRVYGFEEIRGWLTECGFSDVRREPVVGATHLVTAVKGTA